MLNYRFTVAYPLPALLALMSAPFSAIAGTPDLTPRPASEFQTDSSLERGKEACRKSDYTTALRELSAAVKANPEKIESLNWYGYALLQSGKTSEALVYLQKAAQSPEGGADAWANLGNAYLRIGQNKKAVKAFHKATALRPREGKFWVGLGVAQKQGGDVNLAAETLRQAATLLPQDATIWASLGSIEAERGHNPAAISALEAARRLQPENATILLQLADLNAQTGRWDEASEAYGAAAALTETRGTPKGDPNLRYNQGVALMRTGKLQASLGAFDATLTADPNHYDALVNSGFRLYRQNKQDDAILRFSRATGIKPDSALAWTNLAAVYDSKGDLVNAAASWRRATAIEPKNYDYRVSLADCLTRMTQYDALIDVCKEMGALRPRTADPYNRMGIVYLTEANGVTDPVAKKARLTKAMDAFKEATRREPASAASLNNLGVTYERMGMTDSAIAAYRRALKNDSAFADARQNLARLTSSSVDTSPAGKAVAP